MASSSRPSPDGLLNRGITTVIVVGTLRAYVACLLNLPTHTGVYRPGFLPVSLAMIGATIG